jgi:TolB-like protein/Tfp pilus assembly protein PilF
MGIHSGPVNAIDDLNDRRNVAGAGINTAQRIMDCADAGHILVSGRIAEDLAQRGNWRPALHELGEIEVKHGLVVSLFNLYDDTFGNPAPPSRVQERRRGKGRRRMTLPLLVGACLVLLAIVALIWRAWPRPRDVSVVAPAKSIAVLPFDNFSEDKQNAYFADGIQDDILTALSKVADLKVISRSSVQRYREKENRDLRQIGRELNVADLLEGSVRRAGDKIRVTAQLIDARTDHHVWAEHYDRNISDVFAIQSELAQEIVTQLSATISPTEKAALSFRPTGDLQAFDLFLQAKELINTFHDTPDRKQTLLRAVRLLDEAIARDGRFALAYCWAAIAHDNLYWFGLDRTPARLELAESCVRRATELNPDLGETHLAQALVAYHGFRDYARAREHLEVARRALPNSAEVYSLAGYIDRRQGHWDDSLRNLQGAVELDPRNSKVLNDLSVLYDLLRRYDDKEQLYDRAVALNPGSAAYFDLLRAETELAKGHPTKAAEIMKRLPPQYDPDGSATAARVALFLCQGNPAAARAALAHFPNEELVGGTGSLLPRSFFEGQIARSQNDQPAATAAFNSAREKVEAKLHDDPENGLWHGILCVIEAGLGHKDQALAEGRRAVALVPVSKDAVDGPVAEASLAMGSAWLGQTDDAMQLLISLAARPGGPDYGQLLLDPAWRDVRSDPRFQKMLQELAPPDR